MSKTIAVEYSVTHKGTNGAKGTREKLVACSVTLSFDVPNTPEGQALLDAASAEFARNVGSYARAFTDKTKTKLAHPDFKKELDGKTFASIDAFQKATGVGTGSAKGKVTLDKAREIAEKSFDSLPDVAKQTFTPEAKEAYLASLIPGIVDQIKREKKAADASAKADNADAEVDADADEADAADDESDDENG